MKINRFLLSMVMLLSFACTPISFASDLVPNDSGDAGNPGTITSGEVSGEITSGDNTRKT